MFFIVCASVVSHVALVLICSLSLLLLLPRELRNCGFFLGLFTFLFSCAPSIFGKMVCFNSLRKHAYSNIYKISLPKAENFQIKKPHYFSYFCKTENFQIKNIIFHISAQNIDCGYSLEPPRRGGSNEYPQFMLFFCVQK